MMTKAQETIQWSRKKLNYILKKEKKKPIQKSLTNKNSLQNLE